MSEDGQSPRLKARDGDSGPAKPLRFGERLVFEGLISQAELESVLAQQQANGGWLGETLERRGLLTESELLEALARHLNVELVNLSEFWIDQEMAALLPENLARRHSVLIVQEDGQCFRVAMADPGDLIAYDEIAARLEKPVVPVLARKADIDETINAIYRRSEEISNIAEEISEEISGVDEIDFSTLTVGAGKASAPALRLLQSLFEDAISAGASDIHIEPEEFSLRIRTRRDGLLQEQIFRQGRIHAAIVSLLKLMCGLNITERRLPQDGRFQARVQGRSIDVRLSTLPQQYGEGVVLRLLDQATESFSLDNSGMPPAMLRRFRNLISVPYGLILVTGPTGSGKSTTLYGSLSEINRPEVKIITVEDPVEYRIERINQVQVKEEIGLSFARVLRTALRQDPDVVMIGEMRDTETAEIGLRASITGHLVLSTLHTHDAVSTANRLLDMGMAPFMLAAAIRAVIAQRLMRRLCASCREAYRPDEHEQAWLRNWMDESAVRDQRLYRPVGCNSCSQTGYSGRVGIFELLEFRGEMVDALRQGDGAAFTRLATADPDYQPMSEMALDYVQQGVTSLEEVFRVLGQEDERARANAPSAARADDAGVSAATAVNDLPGSV